MTDKLPAHSNVIGGSTAAQRIICAGSYALEQKIPPGPERASEAAERGTALHEAMEYLLSPDGSKTDNLFADAEMLLGMEFNQWTITRQLLDDKIIPACRALDEIIVELGGEIDMMVEVKASIDSILPRGFGTIDILARNLKKPNEILVLDWKFGDGVPIDVNNNYQLGFYAGCALYDPDPEVREMMDCNGEAIDFVFAIVQPRPSFEDEPDYSLWRTTDDWVEDLIDLAVNAVAKANEPDAPLVLGSHCRWCKAKEYAICPLHQDKAVLIHDAPKPSTMDAITMASWLDTTEIAEAFIKSFRAHAHAEAERGVRIPGWKIVDKRPTRTYIDETKAEKVLKRKLKTEGAYAPRKLITPPQAEKKLGKKEYEKLIASNVTKISSGTALVRDTDPRPDVGDASKVLAKTLAKVKGNATPAVFNEGLPKEPGLDKSDSALQKFLED